MKRCQKCGAEMDPVKNAARFCPPCRFEHDRKRMERYRRDMGQAPMTWHPHAWVRMKRMIDGYYHHHDRQTGTPICNEAVLTLWQDKDRRIKHVTLTWG